MEWFFIIRINILFTIFRFRFFIYSVFVFSFYMYKYTLFDESFLPFIISAPVSLLVHHTVYGSTINGRDTDD